MLLKLQDICLKYGMNPLLDNVNLIIYPGDRIALVGRNGAGKSTLLKVIKGLTQVDSGNIECKASLRIGMLEQQVLNIPNQTIFDIVASGLGDIGNMISQYHKIMVDIANPNLSAKQQEKVFEDLQKLQQRIDDNHAWDSQNQVETIISKLDLDPDIEFNSLSGGYKRRVLLAKALVQQPDLLLLDEPTNHLDIESIQWLENFLSNWKTSLLFISHDRAFVRKISTRVIELDRGNLADWPGSYDNFLKKKEEFLHAEELANQKFDKKLAEEEAWIRQGIKARRTRNEGRVRALKKMRSERAERQSLQGNVKASVQQAEKSGKKVIEALNISHAYDNKNIISNFSSLIMRGDKVAIIGANGSGKTTLINILLKNLKPNAGEVHHGTNLEIAYFDQLRQELDDKLSVRDNVAGGSDVVTVNGKDKHIIGYLQDFLFTPERANSPITVLSGGERNRLLLAKLFTKPSNLLVLDEPTNDLDIETLELLEELLVNYMGTVLLISHDREFINNVVTSTIVFEGHNAVKEYIGDYDDWLRQKSSTINPDKSVKSSSVKPNNISKTSTNRLTSQEKQELIKLPKLIEQLEQEQSELHLKSAAEGFYNQDQQQINSVHERLKKIAAELEQAYLRWEDLEG